MDRRKRKPGSGPQRGARQGVASRPGSGAIGLRQVEGIPDTFELVHPRCVAEAELDYQEGIDLWKAGDPEEARDALRYALGACRDNLWVHVALGQLALREFKDPALRAGISATRSSLATRLCHRASRGGCPASGWRTGRFSRRSKASRSLSARSESPGTRMTCRGWRRGWQGHRREVPSDTSRAQIHGLPPHSPKGLEFDFEKYSKSDRRPTCVDFDFNDFSGLRGFLERDRTTAQQGLQDRWIGLKTIAGTWAGRGIQGTI